MVVITTWAVLFANLGSLSLWHVAVHRAARGQGHRWLGPFLGALIIVTLVASVFGWLVLALLYWVLGEQLFGAIPVAALGLGFAALPLLIWELFANAVLSVTGRLKLLNLNQVTARTAGILLLFITIPLLGLGIYGFLIAYLATQITIGAVAAVSLLSQARVRFREGLRQLPELMADGLKMHLLTIGVLLYSSADILMMHYFHGAAAAGIYQFASALFFALLLIPQSSVLALQSKIGSAPLPQLWPEHRTVTIFIVAIMSLIALAAGLAAPWITAILAPSEFREASDALRILMLAIPAASFSWIMIVQWLARGRFLELGTIFLVMGLLNCAMNLYLIPQYGMQGAAWAVVAMWYTLPLAGNIRMAIAAQREAASA